MVADSPGIAPMKIPNTAVPTTMAQTVGSKSVCWAACKIVSVIDLPLQ
jgi:hypothetical protein